MKEKFSKGWEAGEQSGANTATAETLNSLSEFNEAYDKKFGHVFLICATGKSADEMLTAIRDRINNDAATEVSWSLSVIQKKNCRDVLILISSSNFRMF